MQNFIPNRGHAGVINFTLIKMFNMKHETHQTLPIIVIICTATQNLNLVIIICTVTQNLNLAEPQRMMVN